MSGLEVGPAITAQNMQKLLNRKLAQLDKLQEEIITLENEIQELGMQKTLFSEKSQRDWREEWR